MDSRDQDFERPELSSGDEWSNDLRNPGAAGMPGANPGWNDPGQSARGGRSDGQASRDVSLQPIEAATSSFVSPEF